MSGLSGRYAQGDVLTAKCGTEQFSVRIDDAIKFDGAKAHEPGLIQCLLRLFHGEISDQALNFYRPGQPYHLLFISRTTEHAPQ